MYSKLKMTITLTVIGLLSGLSIWGVNELTEPMILSNRERAELAVFYDFFPSGDSVEETAIDDDPFLNATFTVLEGNTVLGYVLRGVSEGYGGRMTILVALEPQGSIVDVRVTSHTETPNILSGLLRDYIPNLQGQAISDVSYDASTGATASYNAIQNVVNATRNVFAGDPFLELLSALEIDADGYNEVPPVYSDTASGEIELLKGSEVVGYMVTLLVEGEEVNLFYHQGTLLKVYSEHLDEALIEALNAQTGQPAEELEGDDLLTLTVVEALNELSFIERLLGHEFIYAKRTGIEGVNYYGTARGFGGMNVFVIGLTNEGDINSIDTLVLTDTQEYYDDIVVPGIARLIAEGADDQTAPDVFAEATATGRSLLNIVLEAIEIHGGE